ncbi:MAG: hypothetical protein JSR80_06110, partial [Verrucomicrobia bacterium]|nr:hypothetical protein [Verrucomicrobiota bacterium]
MFRQSIVIAMCVLSVFSPAQARRHPRHCVEMGQRVTGTFEQHYEAGKAALEAGDWRIAIRHMELVATQFEGHPQAAEGHYWKGVAYFNMSEWRKAHQCLAEYFKRDASPKYFEDACRIRLEMANRIREGEGEHLFGVKQMPRWSKARELALEMYDEVSMSMPSSELGAQAFYGKGQLLWE